MFMVVKNATANKWLRSISKIRAKLPNKQEISVS